MMFKVTKIFDGDTFEIYPCWNWNDNTGNIVGLKGIKSPFLGSPDYDEAKIKLEKVILNKQVDLRNPMNLHTGRLLCDVFVDGDDVREHLGCKTEE